MGAVILFTLLFFLGLNGLIFLGIYNNRRRQERLYLDTIRQLRIVSISRGMNSRTIYPTGFNTNDKKYN